MEHGELIGHRVDRDILVVSGADAESYLQGQCSQDVTALAEGASTEALLLSPQGKIDAWVRCTRTAVDAFVLDMDAGVGPEAQTRLERFRLRVDVTIEPKRWTTLALRGPTSTAAASHWVAEMTSGSVPRVVPAFWVGIEGVDVLGAEPADDPALTSWCPPGVRMVDEREWEALRIAVGEPRGGREVTAATIPAEVGLVDRTVSFTKGCYTGQELVARLDARGSKVARRLCGLRMGGDEVPPVGAAVWTVDGEHQVGEVTSSAPSMVGPVALTVLHRRVEVPGSVVVRWSTSGEDVDRPAEAMALPLLP